MKQLPIHKRSWTPRAALARARRARLKELSTPYGMPGRWSMPTPPGGLRGSLIYHLRDLIRAGMWPPDAEKAAKKTLNAHDVTIARARRFIDLRIAPQKTLDRIRKTRASWISDRLRDVLQAEHEFKLSRGTVLTSDIKKAIAESDIAGRVDRHLDRMRATFPGITLTRTHAVRALVLKALQLEEEKSQK